MKSKITTLQWRNLANNTLIRVIKVNIISNGTDHLGHCDLAGHKEKEEHSSTSLIFLPKMHNQNLIKRTKLKYILQNN